MFFLCGRLFTDSIFLHYSLPHKVISIMELCCFLTKVLSERLKVTGFNVLCFSCCFRAEVYPHSQIMQSWGLCSFFLTFGLFACEVVHQVVCFDLSFLVRDWAFWGLLLKNNSMWSWLNMIFISTFSLSIYILYIIPDSLEPRHKCMVWKAVFSS